jgi:outer membrane receptor protein involved in Fe transport
LQLRTASGQFDDDQNLFRLGSFFTLDGFLSRRVNRWLSIFAAGENLLNSRIESGRTPVLTQAAPRIARAGIRINVGKN